MVWSEKALKPVQTQLPGLSAIYRYTKFGMASFFVLYVVFMEIFSKATFVTF